MEPTDTQPPTPGPASGAAGSPADVEITPSALRRLMLLSVLPVVGVLMFAAGGALLLRAVAHNDSLNCDPMFGRMAHACSHYSYALPVTLLVLGIVVTMAAGAFASYYAARHVGLPLYAALRRRR